MHNTIFEISTEPFNPNHMMALYEIEDNDWFFGPIADYIVQIVDEEEIISMIEETFDDIPHITLDLDEKSFYMDKQFKLDHFEDRFNQIKDMVGGMDIHTFIDNSTISYKIMSLLEDKYDLYIYWDGELITFDKFAREAVPGKKYYFGSVFDYHS